jgi:hypothetical protein
MPVQFLNEVLGACHNVELHVVATVCDMGTNNVKALKLFCWTSWKPLFQFQNQAVASIYGPPHLKCTHNVFLKYDVQLESERLNSQLPVIAKWEHIEKLFRHYKHGMIRMLYKLTDTHLPLLLIVPWKWAWLLKVMSHTAAAGIYTLVSLGVLW